MIVWRVSLKYFFLRTSMKLVTIAFHFHHSRFICTYSQRFFFNLKTLIQNKNSISRAKYFCFHLEKNLFFFLVERQIVVNVENIVELF